MAEPFDMARVQRGARLRRSPFFEATRLAGFEINPPHYTPSHPLLGLSCPPSHRLLEFQQLLEIQHMGSS